VHGISRGVSANVFRFIAEANRHGLCIVAPLFTQEKYGQYQQLVDRRTGVRSDLALLDIIEAAALLTGADNKRLLMFGYSGGAQFAQRFALAYPELAASVALAAAGWYTMPDPRAPYPYGLDGAAIEFKLDAAVLTPQHVFVGDGDVARDASLRRSRDLDLAQGRNRLERATAYVNAMRAAAEARGGRPPSLELLTGVGHDFVESVERADLARRVFAHFATDAGLTPIAPTTNSL
jgi:pimeloyl-ACP methyl ester carboxylesterase